MLLFTLCFTTCLLLKDIQELTISLGQRYQWLLVSDEEDVVFAGGKGLTIVIFHVHNIETTQMALHVLDLADSTDVVTTCHVA